MLRLEEIKRFYPKELQTSGNFLLREYLQYKILEIVYNSQWGRKLSFLGGTCLRIIHGNQRFSEDLDFDNLGLEGSDFLKVAKLIERELDLEGYEVEIKVVQKAAYHCYIRFPKILFSEGLSGHREQKILIQLDTEPQHFDYTPELRLLNKFDVFTEVFTCPLNLLLAQKIFAVINRKRNKGRDFYDISFLLSLGASTDLNYLNQKTGIDNPVDLKAELLKKCSNLDMKAMADDVAPFLFKASERRKVEKFPMLVEQSF